jgi:hypothetical protein
MADALVRIRAVPEGPVVSNPNVLATIENTDPDFGQRTTLKHCSESLAPTTVAKSVRRSQENIKVFEQQEILRYLFAARFRLSRRQFGRDGCDWWCARL